MIHLKKLASGEAAESPVYDFTDHTRKKETRHVEAKPVVIVEGLLIFALPKMRILFDYKIFLEVDADLRVCRRVLRDVAEGRDGSVEAAIRQYLRSARPMDKLYVLPQRKYADEVIDWNIEDPKKIKKLTKKILKLASENPKFPQNPK
jgi:uridine kinase